MLSHDFHLLLCPLISSCDQTFGVLSLGVLFGVKNIITYRNTLMSNVEGFKHMNLPPKSVSHSNVTRVLLMIAYDCTFFINYDLIWGHIPNKYVSNG